MTTPAVQWQHPGLRAVPPPTHRRAPAPTRATPAYRRRLQLVAATSLTKARDT